MRKNVELTVKFAQVDIIPLRVDFANETLQKYGKKLEELLKIFPVDDFLKYRKV